YNRRDLWEAIETGRFPEWELGVQLVPEEDEFAFDFDLLDATKIIPEEQVPVRPVGKLTLNRNPDNFFAETEQIAFHTANVVPGIDFTNDPLLQARNFSYLDTQLIRLGGPNFAQLPVNRPLAEVHNDQRDGYGQHRVHTSATSYSKNSISGGYPHAGEAGSYTHYTEKVEGAKVRNRSESFKDFYSQATLFWNSMTEVEAEHIVAAYRFELGKVTDHDIRARVVDQLRHVDLGLAVRVAEGIGVPAPTEAGRPNHGRSSPALSQLIDPVRSCATRKVAVLAADGVDGEGLARLVEALRERGAVPEVIGITDGTVRASTGPDVRTDRALPTMASVLYDAVAVPDGAESVAALARDGRAVHFVTEAYKHAKAVAAFGAGRELLRAARVDVEYAEGAEPVDDQGVVTVASHGSDLPESFVDAFAEVIAGHRCWSRRTEGVAA
ncbi:MAG TPA: catalase, partial [Glycomyces sp.]|nr:catalase [Glycomyces sp.]